MLSGLLPCGMSDGMSELDENGTVLVQSHAVVIALMLPQVSPRASA